MSKNIVCTLSLRCCVHLIFKHEDNEVLYLYISTQLFLKGNKVNEKLMIIHIKPCIPIINKESDSSYIITRFRCKVFLNLQGTLGNTIFFVAHD